MPHRMATIPGIRNITLMTHFANADELEHPRLGVAEQVERFVGGAQGLEGERSLSNSGGVLHQAVLAADRGGVREGAEPVGHPEVVRHPHGHAGGPARSGAPCR